MLRKVGAVGYAQNLPWTPPFFAGFSGKFGRQKITRLDQEHCSSSAPGVVSSLRALCLQLHIGSEGVEGMQKDCVKVIHCGRPLHIRAAGDLQSDRAVCLEQGGQQALHEKCNASGGSDIHQVPAATNLSRREGDLR